MEHSQNEMKKLMSLLDSMESGIIPADQNDIIVVKEKIDGYKTLIDLQTKILLAQSGISPELLMTQKQKKVFLWIAMKLVKIPFLWR